MQNYYCLLSNHRVFAVVVIVVLLHTTTIHHYAHHTAVGRHCCIHFHCVATSHRTLIYHVIITCIFRHLFMHHISIDAVIIPRASQVFHLWFIIGGGD